MQSVAYKKIFDGSLISILENLKSKQVKVSVSVKMLPFLKTLREKSKEFDEIRLDLCKSFAKKDEQGQPITIEGSYAFDAEGQAQFNKSFSELLEQEIDFPDAPIDIKDIEHLELPISHVEVLSGFLLKE